MNYLLDTDVVIDFLKDKDPGFSLLKDIAVPKNQLYMSVVSRTDLDMDLIWINKSILLEVQPLNPKYII